MFMCVLGRLVASKIIIISTRTFRRALTASVDMLRGNKECPAFSGVTKSGRVWRKVPESDARSVDLSKAQKPSLLLKSRLLLCEGTDWLASSRLGNCRF